MSWSRAVVAAEALWLGAGIAGWLPRWLGGRLEAWSLVRSAHPDAWLLAIVIAVCGTIFIVRMQGRHLDLEETTSASYVPTALLYVFTLVGAAALFYLAIRLVVGATIPAALKAVAVGIGAFALGVAALWQPPGWGGRAARWCVVAAALGLATVAGVLLWPIRVTPVLAGLLFARAATLVGSFLDSWEFVAAAVGLPGIVCLAAWWASIAYARRSGAVGLDGKKITESTGYEPVVVALGCWWLVVAGAALLRAPNGIRASGFAPPVVPDPVIFTVVAFPLAAFIAVVPARFISSPAKSMGKSAWARGLRRLLSARRAALTVVLVLPLLAFLPFAVPAALGPGGRLAVLAVVVPAAYGVLAQGRQDRGRRLCWLVGTTAVSVPLLAYLAVAAGQHVPLTNLLTESGRASTGVGIVPHLRMLLLLPLFVIFVSSRPTPYAGLKSQLPRSRWRDLEADVLIFAVRDGDLDDIYLDSLRERLAALAPDERTRYALALAERLFPSYAPPGSRLAPQPPDQAVPDCRYPTRASVKEALKVAQRLQGENASAPADADVARACQLLELVGCPTEFPGDSDPTTRRATDMVETLRLALGDQHCPSSRSVELLVAVSRREVEDVAAKVISGPHAGKVFENRLAKAREIIGQQFQSLQTPERHFSIYAGFLRYLWLTPGFILNKPTGARHGLDLPVGWPYRYLYLSMGLICAFAVAMLMYFSFVLFLPPLS